MKKSQLDKYSEKYSKPQNIDLQYIINETATHTDLPQMYSGHIQGKLLSFLVKLIAPKLVLELGTFTGYSTLAIASELGPDAIIHTCDVNKNTAKIARRHFDNSPHSNKIHQHIGRALETIPKIQGTFDFIFIDADKLNYPQYIEMLLPRLKVGGIMVLDNMLWNGEVLNPERPSAKGICKANQMLRDNPNIDNFLLNFRDGMQIVTKK